MIFKENGMAGLKSPTGEVVLPALYDGIGIFFGGLSKVRLDGKYALVNRKG